MSRSPCKFFLGPLRFCRNANCQYSHDPQDAAKLQWRTTGPKCRICNQFHTVSSDSICSFCRIKMQPCYNFILNPTETTLRVCQAIHCPYVHTLEPNIIQSHRFLTCQYGHYYRGKHCRHCTASAYQNVPSRFRSKGRHNESSQDTLYYWYVYPFANNNPGHNKFTTFIPCDDQVKRFKQPIKPRISKSSTSDSTQKVNEGKGNTPTESIVKFTSLPPLRPSHSASCWRRPTVSTITNK